MFIKWFIFSGCKWYNMNFEDLFVFSWEDYIKIRQINSLILSLSMLWGILLFSSLTLIVTSTMLELSHYFFIYTPHTPHHVSFFSYPSLYGQKFRDIWIHLIHDSSANLLPELNLDMDVEIVHRCLQTCPERNTFSCWCSFGCIQYTHLVWHRVFTGSPSWCNPSRLYSGLGPALRMPCIQWPSLGNWPWNGAGRFT